MTTSLEKRGIIPLLLGLASLVLIVAGLRAVSDLMSPILLSLFVAMVTTPLMQWLKARGLPGWLAYTLVLLGVIVSGLILILFLAASLAQLSAELPTYRNLIDQQLTELVQWLDSRGIQGQDIKDLEWFQPGRIFQALLYFVSALLGTVSNVGFTLLIFIYMLASAPNFSGRLHHGLATDPPMLARFRSFSSSISTYLLIKSWLGALTALLQIVLMGLLGINFAILWGVFSFLFNFIPNVGFYISLIPPTLIALLTLGWAKALIFAVGYTLINNFFDIAIAPRYLGKGLDLSTIVTFLAVVFWAWILGPIGAFLALPLTVMVKTLLLEPFPETQLLAQLMGSGSPNESLAPATAENDEMLTG
ncbi:AI-2E family transporter [Phormidium sp. FACHB-1136]|uniref:AI-2E family transporter n=1 Tax=Phormidium sp. FACHB-1136 TaxID=2692848 RepID=UPI001687DBA8|nr:AI-2E family transporter [Phormidium sp. FACHB-1136]MBD2426937.1 AI-2E family transporter [Phormidium sp. FACHB-1136]